MDQPVRRKRGGLLPARWEMLGAPACRISIAGCWSMPAISKLRITGAGGLRRTTERLPRDRARARSACKPALSTRMKPREIESQLLSRRELADCLRESRRRGEVQLSRQPNTTRISERRNVQPGHHGSYIPRYRSTYARYPAIRVCSRVRLSACLTRRPDAFRPAELGRSISRGAVVRRRRASTPSSPLCRGTASGGRAAGASRRKRLARTGASRN